MRSPFKNQVFSASSPSRDRDDAQDNDDDDEDTFIVVDGEDHVAAPMPGGDEEESIFKYIGKREYICLIFPPPERERSGTKEIFRR